MDVFGDNQYMQSNVDKSAKHGLTVLEMSRVLYSSFDISDQPAQERMNLTVVSLAATAGGRARGQSPAASHSSSYANAWGLLMQSRFY